jgi:hypothetical protein
MLPGGCTGDGGADQGRLDDPAAGGALHGSRFRGILVEGQVSPGAVVVARIRVQQATQVGLAEHDHAVEALAAQGPDVALDIGILPRGARCDLHLVDPQDVDPRETTTP